MSQQNRDGERKFPCSLCQRQFSTERGGSLHLNACTTLAVMGTTFGTVNVSAANASNLQRSSPHCVWGRLTKDDLKQVVDAAYEEIMYWRKNLFLLPRGAAGSGFSAKLRECLELWLSKIVRYFIETCDDHARTSSTKTKFQINIERACVMFGTTLAVMGTRRL